MTDDLLATFRSAVPIPDHATAQRIYARSTSRRLRVPRRRLVLAVAVVALVVPAAVLGSGLISGPPSPQWVGSHLRDTFISDVATGARQDPGPRYTQADRASILRVLAKNSARFGYRVSSVTVLPGRDGAPLIILSVPGDLGTFARSVPALERIVDPLTGTVDPSTGEYRMKYEAFFLEADDGHGVPAVVVWNVWRQPIGGGGQWAREESLFPSAHG